ncbi:MAG: VWA domain-containing protein [Acidobacteriia bacterium]|nr:VWA domain-containing protein [Terriglobia bacterium]
MRFRVLLFLLILIPLSSFAGLHPDAGIQSLTPQNPAQQPPPKAGTIRVNTSLVLIPVSVTDAAGHAVKNLQLEDFVVQENGSPVTIEHLGQPGLTRLDMVLTFDLTGSTRPRFDFEQQAATSFLKTIFKPRDAVSIVGITAKPKILLERTTSLITAMDGLNQLQSSGASTAFFDSVIAAAQLLRGPADPDTRRVQIVLSDGEDNFSEQKQADALREVQQADCIFYSINPGGPSIRLNNVSLRGQQAMEALAEETGGAAFLAEKLEDLGEIYGRIAAELEAQYLLSYYSPDPKSDGSFRRITVRAPKHPELRVRSRQGYYDGKPPYR